MTALALEIIIKKKTDDQIINRVSLIIKQEKTRYFYSSEVRHAEAGVRSD